MPVHRTIPVVEVEQVWLELTDGVNRLKLLTRGFVGSEFTMATNFAPGQLLHFKCVADLKGHQVFEATQFLPEGAQREASVGDAA